MTFYFAVSSPEIARGAVDPEPIGAALDSVTQAEGIEEVRQESSVLVANKVIPEATVSVVGKGLAETTQDDSDLDWLLAYNIKMSNRTPKTDITAALMQPENEDDDINADPIWASPKQIETTLFDQDRQSSAISLDAEGKEGQPETSADRTVAQATDLILRAPEISTRTLVSPQRLALGALRLLIKANRKVDQTWAYAAQKAKSAYVDGTFNWADSEVTRKETLVAIGAKASKKPGRSVHDRKKLQAASLAIKRKKLSMMPKSAVETQSSGATASRRRPKLAMAAVACVSAGVAGIFGPTLMEGLGSDHKNVTLTAGNYAEAASPDLAEVTEAAQDNSYAFVTPTTVTESTTTSSTAPKTTTTRNRPSTTTTDVPAVAKVTVTPPELLRIPQSEIGTPIKITLNGERLPAVLELIKKATGDNWNEATLKDRGFTDGFVGTRTIKDCNGKDKKTYSDITERLVLKGDTASLYAKETGVTLARQHEINNGMTILNSGECVNVVSKPQAAKG